MRGERATMSELRRRRVSSEQHDEVERNDIPLLLPTEVWRNAMPSTWRPDHLDLKHLTCIDLLTCINFLPNPIPKAIGKLKHLKTLYLPWRNLEMYPPFPERRDAESDSIDDFGWFHSPQLVWSTMMETMIEAGWASGNPAEPLLPPEVEINDMWSESRSRLEPLLPPDVEINDMLSESRSRLEPLLPPEVEGNDMSTESCRINLEEFLALPERRDAEHGSFTLCFLHTPRYTEVETMIETGCASGNPAEAKREWMAFLVTNIASIVLCALMVFASIESKSLSIIASILDPFFDLLWGFILWLTFHAMQNPNQHKYPMGMKRLQPVGMIVFGSFGLQLLFQAAKQFITKSEPEKDSQKEKWMIGVMTFVTMVQLMLAFYCRRFENKILRAYAEHHSSNVITNLISVAAAVLAIRYYWWIDPTGAIITLLYTMNTWKKTFFENLFVLIGRTAPPEILEKVKTLIDHHDDIKEIGRLGAYTFVSDEYFVEVDIVLPHDINRSQAHVIGEILQVKLELLPEVARAFVHIDFEDTHRVQHRPMV